MMWRQLAIAGMTFALANCEGSQINQADVMGEYHATVPSGVATLVINSDYTWSYHVTGPQDFTRSGKWVPEPSDTTPFVYVITFERFEFGFPVFRADPQKPSFWPAQFSKDYTEKVRACIRDGEICFKHS